MSLVTQGIKNLVNGVSQQAAVARLPSQGKAQQNLQSSVVDGLKRRPPTRHIAKLSATTGYANAAIHLIDRDGTEKYAAVFLTGAAAVYDLKTGAAKTVTYADAASYLASTNPRQSLKFATAGDFTFIVNKSVVAGMLSTLSPVRDPEAIIFIRAGDYREKFSLTLGASTWTLTMPRAQTSDLARTYIHSNKIAADLYELLTTGVVADCDLTADPVKPSYTGPGIATGYTFTLKGSLIHITRPDHADFSISGSDGAGDDHMRIIKGQVQKFSDLPKKGIDGFVVKVLGDPDNADTTSYWVKYEGALVDVTTATPVAGGDTGVVPPSGSGIIVHDHDDIPPGKHAF